MNDRLAEQEHMGGVREWIAMLARRLRRNADKSCSVPADAPGSDVGLHRVRQDGNSEDSLLDVQLEPQEGDAEISGPADSSPVKDEHREAEFLHRRIYENSDSPITAVIDDLAQSLICFNVTDVARLSDLDVDSEALVDLIEQDGRFVKLGTSGSGERFIPAEALFEWWGHMTVRLSRADQSQLDQDRLLSALDSLLPEGHWEAPPSEAIDFGSRFGFVRHSSESDLYVFPLAGCLSHLSPDMTERAAALLPKLYTIARSGTSGLQFVLSQGGTHTVASQSGSVAGVWSDVLGTITPREQRVIRLRFGLEDGRVRTLEEVGREYKVTRERIRQIQNKALRKLRHPTRTRRLLRGFLCDLMARQGSLIISRNDPDMAYRTLLAECLGIPLTEVPECEVILLGIRQADAGVEQGRPGRWSDLVDDEEIMAAVVSRYGLSLCDSDLQILAESLKKNVKRSPGKKAQKVRMALQEIGKPAHYSVVAEVYNSLFPETPMSEHNVHSTLSKEPLDIVWIGLRGTYALKAWGYEHPSTSLFDTVTEIVKSKFEETGTPVPFEIIAAEMGRYRKVVSTASLTIAAQCNPQLKRLPGNVFVPLTEAIQKEEDLSADQLDSILQELEEQRLGALGHEEQVGGTRTMAMSTGNTRREAELSRAGVEEECPRRNTTVLSQTSLYSYAPRFFFELAGWAKREDHLRPWQRHFIFDIGRYRSWGRRLSEKQEKVALQIIREARDLGFDEESAQIHYATQLELFEQESGGLEP